jgi:hypothetical protein
MSTSDRLRNRTEIPRARSARDDAPDDRFWPLAGLAALAFLVLIIGAGIAIGWEFAIPVLALALAGALFVGVHRVLSKRKTAVRDGQLVDTSADDASDPVPHVGMDAGDLGNTPQAPPGGHDIPIDAPNKGAARRTGP